MNIYKHIVYNPHMTEISAIIQMQESQNGEWCFVRSQPVTEYEWVAIFEKWQDEFGKTPTSPDNNTNL